MSLRIAASPVEAMKTYIQYRDGLLEALIDNGDGRVTEDTALAAILAGDWQLIYTDASVALTQIVSTPHSPVRIFYVHTVAGELSDCVIAMGEIKRLAARLGCQKVEVSGRKGWEKVLSGSGFRFASLNLVADADDSEESE